MNQTMPPMSSPPVAAATPARLDLGAVALLLPLLGAAAIAVFEHSLRQMFAAWAGSGRLAEGALRGSFCVTLLLGCLVGQRLAVRSRRPLRLLAGALLLAAAGGIALWMFAPDPGARRGLSAAAAVLVQLLPVAGFGAALSLLGGAFVREGHPAAHPASIVAAALFGAAGGTLLSSLLLLPTFGTAKTQVAAAVALGILALLVAALARRAVPAGQPPERDPAPESGRLRVSGGIHAVALGFFLASAGILLSRGLLQVTQGSLSSAGIREAVLLVALALGGVAGRWLARDPRGLPGLVAAGWSLAVTGVVLALHLLYRLSLSDGIGPLLPGLRAITRSGRLWGEASTVALVGGLTLFAAGVIVAGLLAATAAPSVRSRGHLGSTLAGLSLGVLGGGWLVPRLVPAYVELRLGFVALAAIALVFLLVLLLRDRAGRRLLWLPATGLLVSLGLVVLPAGPLRILDAPLHFYRIGVPETSRLIYYAEGAAAHVAVVELPSREKIIQIDHKAMFGGGEVRRIEGMQALLPLLLKGRVDRALLLGVGAGITAGTLRSVGVVNIDAVEPAGGVFECLDLFRLENGGLKSQVGRGLEWISDDPEAFVQSAPAGSYDLILGDLDAPGREGAGRRSSREYFQNVQRLLSPEGVFCQWLPGHQLRWEELGSIGRTFGEVFEGATLWMAQMDYSVPVVGLVAGKRRLRIDVPALQERMGAFPRPDLLASHRIPETVDLLSLYIGDSFFFRDRFAGREVNTLDHPWVEFEAARRMVTDEVVALNNREQFYDLHEDIVGIMSTEGVQPKERAKLAKELARASDVAWEIFHARTLRLHAAANRQIPVEYRVNDPEELEVKAFQSLAGILQQQPENEAVLEMIIDQLKSQLARLAYASVVQAASELMADERIGEQPRLRNLRGMALLLAACDERQRALFTDPLLHSSKDFAAAYRDSPQLIEAGLNLAVSLFLQGQDRECLSLLREARTMIRSETSADGYGLPLVAEGIYQLLTGHPGDAADLLVRLPEALPYRGAVLERLRSWSVTESTEAGRATDGP